MGPQSSSSPFYSTAEDFCQRNSQKSPSWAFFLTFQFSRCLHPSSCSCHALCGTLGIVFTPQTWCLEKSLPHLCWKTPRLRCSLSASPTPPLEDHFAQQDRKIFLHLLPSMKLFSNVFLPFSNVFLPISNVFFTFFQCVFYLFHPFVHVCFQECSAIRLLVRMGSNNQG